MGTSRGDFGEFVVEIRSVNNRHLDLSVRLPKELAFFEPTVRDIVRRSVGRGKVDVFVRWTPSPAMPPLAEINVALLRHYVEELRSLSEVLGSTTLDLGALLTLPGVVNPTATVLDSPQLESGLRDALLMALESFNRARAAEGRALGAAVREHLACFQESIEAISGLKPELDQKMLERLAERIRKLAENAGVTPEPGRLEMELTLAADKADVTEELVRLRSHLSAFERQMSNDDATPVGKALDFLVQEINREITTLGNKAREAEISPYILRAKNELEKIREQVQNIE